MLLLFMCSLCVMWICCVPMHAFIGASTSSSLDAYILLSGLFEIFRYKKQIGSRKFTIKFLFPSHPISLPSYFWVWTGYWVPFMCIVDCVRQCLLILWNFRGCRIGRIQCLVVLQIEITRGLLWDPRFLSFLNLVLAWAETVPTTVTTAVQPQHQKSLLFPTFIIDSRSPSYIKQRLNCVLFSFCADLCPAILALGPPVGSCDHQLCLYFCFFCIRWNRNQWRPLHQIRGSVSYGYTICACDITPW